MASTCFSNDKYAPGFWRANGKEVEIIVGLYRRGRVYWVNFYINGQRVLQSTGTRNRRDAEQIYQELRRRANAQRHHVALGGSKMLFSELASQFLTKTGNREYHRDRLDQLLPVFGPRRITTISRAMVDAYRTDRLEEVSNATVNRDVAVLRHVLFWAVDEGFLAANSLSRYRQLTEPRRPRRVLSVAEEDLLLDAAVSHLEPIVIVALDTGMRRGEILGQRREHLDADRQLLTVSKSNTVGGTGREIPWTKRARRILTPLSIGDGLVFIAKGQSVRSIKRAWRGAVRRAGIRHVRFHDLRHSFNTRLMEAGVSQDVRKTLMGHAASDINDVYTSVELLAKRRAIAKLETWIEEQKRIRAEENENQDEDDTCRQVGKNQQD